MATDSNLDGGSLLPWALFWKAKLHPSRCDPWWHQDLWQWYLSAPRKFQYEPQETDLICTHCGVNCRDRSTHPTLEEFDMYFAAHEEYDALLRAHHALLKKAKNNREMGPRELTLTYSPKWEGFSDEHAQEIFRQAEERLLKYYRHELIQYRSVGEYTKAGCSHLHIMYTLSNGGKFTDKNIQRAYSKWNAKKCQGGHHSLVKSVSDFAGYLEKSLKDNWHFYEHNHAPSQNSTLPPPSSPDDASSSALSHPALGWTARA